MLLWSAGVSNSSEDSPEPAPLSSSSDTFRSSAFPCTATCRITAVTLSSLPSRCPSTLSISLIVSQPSWRSFASTLHWPWAPSSGLWSCLPCGCSTWAVFCPSSFEASFVPAELCLFSMLLFLTARACLPLGFFLSPGVVFRHLLRQLGLGGPFSVVLRKVSLNPSEFECSLLSSYVEPTVPSA